MYKRKALLNATAAAAVAEVWHKPLANAVAITAYSVRASISDEINGMGGGIHLFG